MTCEPILWKCLECGVEFKYHGRITDVHCPNKACFEYKQKIKEASKREKWNNGN